VLGPGSKIKGAWDGLKRLEDSPHEIGLGLALGVFASFLPIIPFQTIAGLALALAAGGNKVSCVVGLHLHMLAFPLIPLMFVAEFELGRRFVEVPLVVELDGERWRLADLLEHGWPVLRAMLAGALVLATPAALAAYLVARFGVEDWRKRRPRKSAGPEAQDPKDSREAPGGVTPPRSP
jgi:uncharacterized protein (DUF2062 family)